MPRGKRNYKGRTLDIRTAPAPKRRYKKKPNPKNAYANRKNFRPNIQPFTETKKITEGNQAADVVQLPTTSAFTMIAPHSYLFRKQGTAEGEMVGDNIYGRYLGTKLRFVFPSGSDSLFESTKLHIYYITVHQDFALTKYTSPTMDGAAGPSKTQVENHIANQLKEFYDTKNDRMQFHDRLSGFTINKHHQIKANRNAQISMPQNASSATTGWGTVGDQFHNYSWTIKQKLHYQPWNTTEGGTDTHYLNRPGRAGYKAIVIYNPDFEHQGTTARPDSVIKYDWNDCLWYGDS